MFAFVPVVLVVRFLDLASIGEGVDFAAVPAAAFEVRRAFKAKDRSDTIVAPSSGVSSDGPVGEPERRVDPPTRVLGGRGHVKETERLRHHHIRSGARNHFPAEECVTNTPLRATTQVLEATAQV
jgi:hypothetical protein